MSKKGPVMRVPVEHECYIPVAYYRISAALVRQLTDPRQQENFDHFCKLVHSIYHFEYHHVSQQLKRDYASFSSDTGAREYAGEAEESLDVVEMRFLKNFFRVMEAGNFRLLTQHDVDMAEQEDYMFTLPIRIDWDKLDKELISRFIREHMSPEQIKRMPKYADRILIYKRGVGIDQVKGFLTLQKIDILVNQSILALVRLPAYLLGRRKATSEQEQPPQAVDPHEEDPITLEDSSRNGLPTGSLTGAAGPVAAGPVAAGPVDPLATRGGRRKCSKIHDDGYVERIPLRNTRTGLSWLFRRTLLQEPTFKEVIILFRPAPPEAKRGQEPPPADRSIIIKAFRDIPMVDLEVIFPEKRISMKPLDLIKLFVTGMIGLVVVLAKLLSAAFNPVLALAALSAMGGYASKIFFGFKNSRDRYQHLVTDSLYHKNLDNDLGVIFYLMDSLEEQEFKEAVLAYFFLWREGPMTEEELDHRCERFLLDKFDLKIDFEIDDAAKKLVAEGLAQLDGDVYHACPIEKALETLDHKWDNYFKFNLV